MRRRFLDQTTPPQPYNVPLENMYQSSQPNQVKLAPLKQAMKPESRRSARLNKTVSSCQKSGRTNLEIPDQHLQRTGFILLLFTFLYFVFNIFSIVVSKHFKIGVWWMDVFSQDHYYCYLLPLSGPVFLMFAIINWVGKKYFMHTNTG